MKILVACEFSGIVRDSFIAKGHDAISCDIIESEQPGPHYKGDVRDILNEQWDLLIAHPPCTRLCNSGNRYRTGKEAETMEAIEFVQMLFNAPIPRIAIENPIGILSTYFQKPSQIIHPWMFGENEKKATCLWLKNLPPLMATCVEVGKRNETIHKMAPGKDRWKNRSRTFKGIAIAMSEQWNY